MTRSSTHRRCARFAVALLGFTACIDDPTFGPSTDSGGIVFLESFGSGVNFEAFSGTVLTALTIDDTVAHSGQKSMKVVVPSPNDPGGTYAGGAFVAGDARDLSSFDSVVFWAMASRSVTLDAAGFGNDNTGTSLYTAQSAGLPIGTTWTKFVLPIPDPSKLTAEKGLFFFAASAQGTPATGFTIWFDDVQFQTLGSAAIGALSGSFDAGASTVAVGSTLKITGAQVASNIGGVAQVLTMDDHYLSFTSSAASIASVAADGTISGDAVGSATITATLAGAPVVGSYLVNVAAPDPTIIALLSANYPEHGVDEWLATWSMPTGMITVSNAPDGTDPMETYSDMEYAGVEFFNTVKEIDATADTNLRIDIKTTDPAEIHIKLVDFGANGVADPPFDGTPHGDDSQGEIVLSPSSTPPLAAGSWVSYDLPFTQFQVPYGMSPGLTNRAHLSQMVFTGPAAGTPLVKTFSVKNLYFHQ